MNPVCFGILGCGMIANFHAEAIRAVPGAVLCGCADLHAESAERFAEKHAIRAYPSPEAMLADPAIEAVCVCTPSGAHGNNALQAITAGKHVLIEKPLAITDADCEAVIRAAAHAGRCAGVVSQLRFSPAVQTAKKLVAEGRLGTPVSVILSMKYSRPQSYYDASPWRGKWATDGGSLMNQGIHGVDMMLYIMGAVKSVSGYAATLAHKMEAEDVCAASLEFQNGALGLIESSTAVSPGYPRKLILSGTRGTLVIEDEAITVCDLEDGAPLPAEEEQEKGNHHSHTDPAAINTAGHEKQIRDFVAAVREKRAPAVPHTEGRNAVRLINAVYRSARHGTREEIEKDV